MALLVVAVLSRCAEPGSERQPAGADTLETAPAESSEPAAGQRAFDGTTEETVREATSTSSALLTDVRVAARDGYDRIVFEFDAPEAPGYTVRYVDEATHCASGHVIPIDAPFILEVSLAPSAAHEFDDDGNRHATVDESLLPNGYDAIMTAQMICDHHGGVTWAVGVSDRAPYRAETLRNPSRLAIDVLQP